MTTRTLSHKSTFPIPRPELGRAGRIATAFLMLLGVGALVGGVALVVRPDGSVIQMDVKLLAGSPFSDFFFPGIILGCLFGVGSFAVAALGLRHSRIAPFLAFAIGCGQMIWIVVELALIREFSFLHPTCFGLGAIIAGAAVVWGGPTFQAWRASR